MSSQLLRRYCLRRNYILTQFIPFYPRSCSKISDCRHLFIQSAENYIGYPRLNFMQRFPYSTSTQDEIALPKTRPASSDRESIRHRPEENRDVRTLLEMIKEKSNSRGTELILADAFIDNLDQSPLALLLNDCPNLTMEYIAEAFAMRPKFFRSSTSQWAAMIRSFQDSEVSSGIMLAALVGNPDILELEPKEINRILVDLGQCGISSRVLASVLAKRPQIMTTDLNEINDLIENMNSFFPRAKLFIMIRRDPDILFMEFEKLEAKYEYIYFEMGLEAEDVFRSRHWHRHPLAMIECRHQFLMRCGAYIMPDQKKKEVAVDNPKLTAILDTDDKEFCKMAGVSLMEWETYKKIFAEEESMELNRMSHGFLRRTRRVSKNEEEEEDWQNVDPDEIEDYGRQNVRKGFGGREERRGRRLVEDDSFADEVEPPSTDGPRKREFYGRSLTSVEIAELKARIEKMKVTGDDYDENDEDDEDSEDELDEKERIHDAERKEQQKQLPRLGWKDRDQFRKRGVFLASED